MFSVFLYWVIYENYGFGGVSVVVGFLVVGDLKWYCVFCLEYKDYFCKKIRGKRSDEGV